MNVAELTRLLEGIDPETEVRIMSQPKWPFEYELVGTWLPPREQDQPDTCGDCGAIEADEIHTPNDFNEEAHSFEPYQSDAFEPEGNVTTIYLVEGMQLGYGTKDAWDEVERA